MWPDLKKASTRVKGRSVRGGGRAMVHSERLGMGSGERGGMRFFLRHLGDGPDLGAHESEDADGDGLADHLVPPAP